MLHSFLLCDVLCTFFGHCCNILGLIRIRLGTNFLRRSHLISTLQCICIGKKPRADVVVQCRQSPPDVYQESWLL
jgi:hypothetical protein